MAFNPAPSAWFGPGYSLSSNMVRLTTATAGSNIALPELTDTEANATTGDIREVTFAIMEALVAAWNATASDDRPVEMVIQKSSGAVLADGTVQYTYTIGMNVTIGTQNVTPEP